MTFRETKRVLFSADLAGFARATARLDALAAAAFLDDWSRHCAAAVRNHGGRIVKFMGDGCLATFGEGAGIDALDAATQLQTAADDLKGKHGVSVEVGVNVHLATVAEGELGADDDRRYDVVGSAVHHLFLMGGERGFALVGRCTGNFPTSAGQRGARGGSL